MLPAAHPTDPTGQVSGLETEVLRYHADSVELIELLGLYSEQPNDLIELACLGEASLPPDIWAPAHLPAGLAASLFGYSDLTETAVTVYLPADGADTVELTLRQCPASAHSPLLVGKSAQTSVVQLPDSLGTLVRGAWVPASEETLFWDQNARELCAVWKRAGQVLTLEAQGLSAREVRAIMGSFGA